LNINNNNNNNTRNELVDEINKQIKKCPYLDSKNSYLTRFNVSSITLDASMTGFKNNSFFQLKLKLNRKTTQNITNSKLKVVFHEDPELNNNIWTGTAGSCFQFYDLSAELNNIISDTYPVQNSMIRYDLSTSAYIRFKCVKDGFTVFNNINDYEIKLINSPYNNSKQYIDGFNVSISNAASNYNSEINPRNTSVFIDQRGYFNFDIDITKEINHTNFQIDLSGFYNPSSNIFSYNKIDNSYNRVGFFTSFFNGINNPLLEQYNYVSSKKSLIGNNNYTVDLSQGNIIHFQFKYQNTYDFYDISYLAIIESNYDPITNFNSKILNDSKISYKKYFVNAPPNGKYYLNQLPDIINTQFTNFKDSDGNNVLSGSKFTFNLNSDNVTVNGYLQIIIKKNLTQKDYNIGFYEYLINRDNFKTDTSTNLINTLNVSNTSWYKYLNINDKYINNINDTFTIPIKYTSKSYATLIGNNPITQYRISLTNKNNYFDIIPIEDGVSSVYNNIRIKLDNITYSRDSLIDAINVKFQNNPLTKNSIISIVTDKNGNEKTKIRLTVNKEYYSKDYLLDFYDPYYFVNCNSSSSFRNTSWDSTLGWMLGYRSNTIYTLSDYTSGKEPIQITADTSISTNLYNYFVICLDDFNNNHFSNGLVTINKKNIGIDLPSYANKSNFICDPITGLLTYDTTTVTDYNNLTQKQIYSLVEIQNSSNSINKVNINKSLITNPYSNGPYIQDVFAIVPLRLAGLANGSYFVDNGGSLQNQQRLYFGPVNLFKFSIQLLDDRGNVVNLNNSNWSFTILCDVLYKPTPSK
jgi:hypothetical protein